MEGSGVSTTAMPCGSPKPETRDAFTTDPDIVYSPIVPVPSFATNRFEPDAAMPNGSINPETSEGFTTAPDVVYSPIVPFVPLT